MNQKVARIFVACFAVMFWGMGIFLLCRPNPPTRATSKLENVIAIVVYFTLAFMFSKRWFQGMKKKQ